MESRILWQNPNDSERFDNFLYTTLRVHWTNELPNRLFQFLSILSCQVPQRVIVILDNENHLLRNINSLRRRIDIVRSASSP